MNQSYWHTLLQGKLPRRRLLALLASAGAGSAILACSGGDDDDDDDEAGSSTTPSSPGETPSAGTGVSAVEPTAESAGVERPAGWTEASHSNDADPDYDVVFPKNRVNQITFTVSPENWQAMLDNMTELAGERGTGQGGFGAGGGAPLDRDPGANGNFPRSGQGGPPGGGGFGGGPGSFTSENPIWVPATIGFNGLEWTNVGLRFKGNSSLRSSWSGGGDKLPFKLDFDEFEGDYPEIDNQRFYGFKQLSLANNWNDASAMREALTYDLLEEAGLVAAQTGFYEVILDHGEGPSSLGLYTVIEVVDDTVIGRYFDDDNGNIYEAEGTAASFAEGTAGQIETSFEVESDEAQADWSDIQTLYDVLHADLRFEDAQAWRASLASVFEVEPFLEWLALSTLIQHWDTYGGMTHNYYLYNNPETGRLNWISWDHNLVLGSGGGGGGGQGAPGGRSNVSFDKSAVGEQWPLISYLISQPEYAQKYNAFVRELIEGVFEPSRVIANIEQYEAILTPIATQANSTYASDVDSLQATVEQRVVAAQDYLASL
jgi:hypothetical protein